MGKLSSCIGGGWRGRWLVLIIAVLLIGDGAFAAKARMRDRSDRSNDTPWGNARSDTVARNNDSASSSGSGARAGNASSNDKANDKNAKNNKDDDDDDDARGNQVRDGGKSQTRAAGAGKSNGPDAAEPPKTVVEMLQRMFPAGIPGGGDAKPTPRSDAGKAGDSDKPSKADAGGKKDQDPAAPAAARTLPQLSTAQTKRAVQRATQPSLSWLRDAKASDLFRRDEVLVVGASPAAMAQLRFAHVETINTATSSISRFVVPEGFDAISARQLLRDQMPSALSAFNYVYRPYVAAMEGGAGGVGQPIRPSAVGCSAERCYGPSLINWVPDATSCVIDIGVGVIDTGFDSQHPAFKDRKINWSTVLEGESVSVQAWHGTGVLALLSGHPQSSTPGLIPNASFTATNTFYADSNGQPATDTTTLIKALKLMDTYKVKVINLSLAGPQDAVLHKQIRDMSEAGVLFVAAAGNGGPFALPSYPAAYPEVIAVTAVDRNLVGYRHATRGPHIDLAAPGVDVWTALPDKKEGPQTGTSFAVPYVTAAAAAVYPKDELVYRGQPLEPKKAVLSRLTTRDLGPAGRDSIYGPGLL